MLDLFTELFKEHGLLALIEAVQICGIVYLALLVNKKDDIIKEAYEKMVRSTESRLKDAIEERDQYQELSKQLDKSINLLVEVFKARRGIE